MDVPEARTFAPGQIIFFQGDNAEFFFRIANGTVRCCSLTADGRRQIYRFASAGEMLGLGGEEELYSYSAEALTEVTVRRQRLASLNAAIARDDRLRSQVLQALRDELAAVRRQNMWLGRMSAAERIASFLRDLSERSTDPEGYVHLPMTRADIADYLGMTLETVSRKMNSLERLQVIEMSTPCHLRIKDFHRLESIANAA